MGLSTFDCGYQFPSEMVAKVSTRNGDWPTIVKKQKFPKQPPGGYTSTTRYS